MRRVGVSNVRLVGVMCVCLLECVMCVSNGVCDVCVSTWVSDVSCLFHM